MVRKKTDWKFILMFLVALAVFLFAAVKLGLILLEYYQGEQTYLKLNKFVVSSKEEVTGGNQKESKEGFSVDFDELRKINPDVVGWIRIEKLGISYPVVQGKDNEYYLSHTFFKEKNKCGSIFMEVENEADFSDSNTFLYGHNMKDKSMFAKLNQYQEEEILKENPEFYIYTPKGVNKYKIYSCYVAELGLDSFTHKFKKNKEYAQWQKNVKGRSLYDTGVVPKPKQKTVTLMTCTPAGEKYRFLVHGVLAE